MVFDESMPRKSQGFLRSAGRLAEQPRALKAEASANRLQCWGAREGRADWQAGGASDHRGDCCAGPSAESGSVRRTDRASSLYFLFVSAHGARKRPKSRGVSTGKIRAVNPKLFGYGRYNDGNDCNET